MSDAGYDVQAVRSEIDWRAVVGFGDEVDAAVSPARFGRTSVALDSEIRRGGTVICGEPAPLLPLPLPHAPRSPFVATLAVDSERGDGARAWDVGDCSSPC